METWRSRAGVSCISLVSRATSSNINAGSREERTSKAKRVSEVERGGKKSVHSIYQVFDSILVQWEKGKTWLIR